MALSQARTTGRSAPPRGAELGAGAPPRPRTESWGCRFPWSSGLGQGNFAHAAPSVRSQPPAAELGTSA
eukprot:11681375-Alexandrium_andersonii.AAC.1